MSTHAAIGMEMPNGTVRAIGLQNDGYPAHAGVILDGYYRSTEVVAQLIALGGLSSLGLDVNSEETVAYSRDRAEEYVDPQEYRNTRAFCTCAEHDFQAEWLYLYRNGKWYCKWAGNAEIFEINTIFGNKQKEK